MIKDNYILYNDEHILDIEESVLKIADIRIGQVSKILTSDKPSLIPFNYKFPIIDPNAYGNFLKETTNELYFEDLPRFIKQPIYIAEKVNYYNNLFLKYLDEKKMSENEFKNKNPKTKQDIFYDFLFSNKLDIGIITL